jgi:hypothetical protein
MNEARTRELARRLMAVVREHYETAPHGRDRVFEAVAALGATAGFVLAGADDEAVRRSFMAQLTATENEALRIVPSISETAI